MPKKTEQNLKVLEENYHFPSVLIDGVSGITIAATSQEEAEKKLALILNKKSND